MTSNAKYYTQLSRIDWWFYSRSIYFSFLGIVFFFAIIAETIGIDTKNFWEIEPEEMYSELVTDVTGGVNNIDSDIPG